MDGKSLNRKLCLSPSISVSFLEKKTPLKKKEKKIPKFLLFPPFQVILLILACGNFAFLKAVFPFYPKSGSQIQKKIRGNRARSPSSPEKISLRKTDT